VWHLKRKKEAVRLAAVARAAAGVSTSARGAGLRGASHGDDSDLDEDDLVSPPPSLMGTTTSSGSVLSTAAAIAASGARGRGPAAGSGRSSVSALSPARASTDAGLGAAGAGPHAIPDLGLPAAPPRVRTGSAGGGLSAALGASAAAAAALPTPPSGAAGSASVAPLLLAQAHASAHHPGMTASEAWLRGEYAGSPTGTGTVSPAPGGAAVAAAEEEDPFAGRVDGLYICLASMHGLVRGDRMELGRDPDTGGQVKYVVELARALAAHPAVHRVDLLTRLVADPAVAPSYSVPAECIAPPKPTHRGAGGGADGGGDAAPPPLQAPGPASGGAYIIRLPCGPPSKYLRKERLWPHVREFADRGIAHARATLARLADAGTPCELYAVHGHYADAGEGAALMASTLGVECVVTGHSLGRNKLDHLLASGTMTRGEVEATYRIARRIEAEERCLDAAALVLTSTRQEVDDQWGLYNGFNARLEAVLRARGRPGRHMPAMAVIPPGLDFSALRAEAPEGAGVASAKAALMVSPRSSGGEHMSHHHLPPSITASPRQPLSEPGTAEAALAFSPSFSDFHAPPGPEPPIWGSIFSFLRNPHKPTILAMSRPDPKKNLLGLVTAFATNGTLRQLANLVLIMGNRDTLEALAPGSRSQVEAVFRLVDNHGLWGSVAFPKHHSQADVADIYRLPLATRGVFVNVALQEPFGLTVIEAAALGVPCVATRNGGPVDIMATLNHGLLVDPTNPAAISEALLSILTRPAAWDAMSRAGRDNIGAYSWPAHCSRYLARLAAVKAGARASRTKVARLSGTWDASLRPAAEVRAAAEAAAAGWAGGGKSRGPSGAASPSPRPSMSSLLEPASSAPPAPRPADRAHALGGLPASSAALPMALPGSALTSGGTTTTVPPLPPTSPTRAMAIPPPVRSPIGLTGSAPEIAAGSLEAVVDAAGRARTPPANARAAQPARLSVRRGIQWMPGPGGADDSAAGLSSFEGGAAPGLAAAAAAASTSLDRGATRRGFAVVLLDGHHAVPAAAAAITALAASITRAAARDIEAGLALASTPPAVGIGIASMLGFEDTAAALGAHGVDLGACWVDWVVCHSGADVWHAVPGGPASSWRWAADEAWEAHIGLWWDRASAARVVSKALRPAADAAADAAAAAAAGADGSAADPGVAALLRALDGLAPSTGLHPHHVLLELTGDATAAVAAGVSSAASGTGGPAAAGLAARFGAVLSAAQRSLGGGGPVGSAAAAPPTSAQAPSVTTGADPDGELPLAVVDRLRRRMRANGYRAHMTLQAVPDDEHGHGHGGVAGGAGGGAGTAATGAAATRFAPRLHITPLRASRALALRFLASKFGLAMDAFTVVLAPPAVERPRGGGGGGGGSPRAASASASPTSAADIVPHTSDMVELASGACRAVILEPEVVVVDGEGVLPAGPPTRPPLLARLAFRVDPSDFDGRVTLAPAASLAAGLGDCVVADLAAGGAAAAVSGDGPRSSGQWRRGMSSMDGLI